MAVGSLLGGWLSDDITKARGKRAGPLLPGGGSDWSRRGADCAGYTNCGHQHGGDLSGGRRRGALSFAEFLLERECGHRQEIGRLRFGRDEHGRADWQRHHRHAHALHRRHFGWNASFLVAAGLVRLRRGRVAVCESDRISDRSEEMIMATHLRRREFLRRAGGPGIVARHADAQDQRRIGDRDRARRLALGGGEDRHRSGRTLRLRLRHVYPACGSGGGGGESLSAAIPGRASRRYDWTISGRPCTTPPTGATVPC